MTKPTLLTFIAMQMLLLFAFNVGAAVLPQERADIMYHSYAGDGMDIDGPSILVRKQIGNNFSVSANYYVDMISGASIDVLATASPYEEERTEHSVGVDFLHNKTLMNLNFYIYYFIFTNHECSDLNARDLGDQFISLEF